MTNKEKFEKEFGYDGSIVSQVEPEYMIRPGSCGYKYCTENCASRYYPRCPHWWHDKYETKRYTQDGADANE